MLRAKDVERALRMIEKIELHYPHAYGELAFIRMLFEEQQGLIDQRKHQWTKDRKKKMSDTIIEFHKERRGEVIK